MHRKKRNTDPNCSQLLDCQYICITVDDESSTEELLDLLEPVPRIDARPKLPKLSDEEKREWTAIIQQVSMILFEHDPMCLDFGTNTDEYEPEAMSILAMLKYGTTEAKISCAIEEVFSRNFSLDISVRRCNPKWEVMAQRIWAAWAKNQE